MLTFIKDKKFLRSVVMLAIPITLQNVITSVLNIFDQTMVGFLPPEIADFCLSAVLLANQLVFIFQIMIFASSNTVNIFIAQYANSDKKDLIPQRVGMVLILNFMISLVVTLVCFFAPESVLMIFNPSPAYAGYATEFLRVVSLSFIPMGLSVTFSFVLRAIKKLNVSLFASFIAVVLNIFFNYIFMFGKLGIQPLGLVGAAWGTFISRSIELVIIISGLIIFKYPILSSPKKMFHFDKVFLKQYFKMFVPVLCNELFWVLSSTIYLFVFDKLPNSEVALAAYNIASSVDKLISVAMIGVGSAAGIILSNIIAEGNNENTQRYKKMTLQFALVVGVLIGLLTLACAFFTPQIFKNVSLDAQVTAKHLLILFAGTAVLRTISFSQIIALLRSGGDTTFAMLAETFAIWIVSVPLVLVGGLVFQWNILVLYLLGAMADVVKITVCGLRLRTSKWIKFKA